MKSSNHNPMLEQAGSGSFEETLRLIAKLPPPEGLEVRVVAGVRASRATEPRAGRILSWPATLRASSDWMRGAAAAAIVFVVVGGGWGVYSRVQRPQTAKVITMPARGAVQGGFSSAGAMHTPTTLNGPVVTIPVTPKSTQPTATAKKLKRRETANGVNKTAVLPMAPTK